MDSHNSLIEYLLNNANEAIRYRVLTELCDVQESDEVDMLREAILNSERYQKLIHCLKERKEYHGAAIPYCNRRLRMDMVFYTSKTIIGLWDGTQNPLI